MAEPRKQEELIDPPRPDATPDVEQDRVRSSNDRDQAVRGNENVEDVDPDSAESEVDRDDSVGD